jgi:hypothetical protein
VIAIPISAETGQEEEGKIYHAIFPFLNDNMVMSR